MVSAQSGFHEVCSSVAHSNLVYDQVKHDQVKQDIYLVLCLVQCLNASEFLDVRSHSMIDATIESHVFVLYIVNNSATQRCLSKTSVCVCVRVVKTRQQEMLALVDAIKILNDDDALELFKKNSPKCIDSSVRTLLHVQIVADRVFEGNPSFDFISLALKGKKIGMEKVIKLIDDLVAELKQDQINCCTIWLFR